MAPDGETRRRIFLRFLLLFLPSCTGFPQAVFMDKPQASLVLQRSRRANYFLEELKAGNLERECVEEKCSYEEAKEIFAQPQQLEIFWRRYTAVDHCASSPCKNGATCTGLVDSYVCKCAPSYHGTNCDRVRTVTGGCRYRNGGCEQFCKEFPDRSFVCFCATGYQLDRDNITCVPQEAIPCGRPQIHFSPRVVRGEMCPKGHCPWQGQLTENHRHSCGAVILSDKWVVTAAHCVYRKPSGVFHITAGEHDLDVNENTEQKRRVSKVVIHRNYNHTNSDSDLAMLKLHPPLKLGAYVVPLCLPAKNSTFSRTLATVRQSTVSGWGRLSQHGSSAQILQRLTLPRVPLQECRLHTRLEITRNMMCAGFKTGGHDACEGDSGGPLATYYKKTWFLTGVVSWGKGCANANLYGVYVRVSNFLEWIQHVMARG